MTKKRIISLILVICIALGSVNFYIFDRWSKASEAYIQTQNDRAIAEDLASMTGMSAEYLLQMKSLSGSWNSVVTDIKNSEGKADDKLSDEQLRQLIKLNEFAENDASEAEMLVEQVFFNLEEIQRNDSFTVNIATVSIEKSDEDENNAEMYRKIAQVFDKNLAIYYSLKLRNMFFSIQAVIEEYLYCIQIEVDLGLLITDEEAYEKAVLEKNAILTREDAITSDDISARMLQSLQPKKSETSENANPGSPFELHNTKAEEPANNFIDAATSDPKPPSPEKEIMDEIYKINQSWMNGR